MWLFGGCELAIERLGPLLLISVSGELAPEWGAEVAQEVWMLADTSDAQAVALDLRPLRCWLPTGLLATLGAFRPPQRHRKAWCLLVEPCQAERADAVSLAYRSSGELLEVFTSLEAASAWSAACA